MPIGRPSSYTEELATTILERIATGEGLAEICRSEGMPGETTVYRWVRENETFRKAYTCAREDQGHTAADSVITVRRKVADGEMAPDVARVVIDSLKWEAGKRAAKYYGDKQLIGSDPANPLPGGAADTVAVISHIMKALNVSEADAMRAVASMPDEALEGGVLGVGLKK